MRLIDANALTEQLNEYIQENREENCCANNFAADVCEVLKDIYVKEAPTVDAVEMKEVYEIVYKLECLLCHATGNKYSKAGYDLDDMCRMVTDYIEECCQEAVDEAVVHGRWRRVFDDSAGWVDMCSNCKEFGDTTPYCPNCGAKMDGDGNG